VLTRVVCLLLVCALLGCGSKPRAPVEDRNARNAPSSRMYTVQRGDTLYSIAFRYGMDYRKVAAANRIPAPYTIYAGQKLYLKEAPVLPAPSPVAARKPAASPVPASQPQEKQAAQQTAPGDSPPRASPAPPVTRPPSPAVATAATVKPSTTPAVAGWRWPTTGRVVRGYSSSVHKGIDISGQRGDAIQAVADGTVVYAGTGIVGMGELVIVKHSEIYLSAYAHNERLLVGEGERVRAGQKIATKGSSGTDSVKLHFEIRREGKPIDPQKLLPPR
jgi:lipoprotein NlpD